MSLPYLTVVILLSPSCHCAYPQELHLVHRYRQVSLASTTKRQHQMQGRAAFELVLSRRLIVRPTETNYSVTDTLRPSEGQEEWHVHLLAPEDQTLLDWRNSFLFLDAFLDPRDLCRRISV